jgi:lysophospholipase L1-like esterase
MQATHGSETAFRGRGRLLGGLFALVLLVCGLVFSPVAQALKTPPPETDYLALGDSLAFGYTQEKFNNNFPPCTKGEFELCEPPSAFEEGYDHFLAKKLRGDSKKASEQAGEEINLKGLVDINNGCPGETTDSLIGNGALAAAFGIPGESPCDYHKKGFRLHHEYGGVSQLENTIGVLAAKAGKVKDVTLDIGANDELHALAKCEKEVTEEYEKEGKSKYGPNPKAAVNGCIGAHVEELFKHIIENIGRILFAVDHGSAFGGVDYTGPIEFLGFYNPNTFVNPGTDTLQKTLNEQIELTFTNPESPNYVPNLVYGNPFLKTNGTGFNATREKEKIAKYTEMCNPNVQKPTTGEDPGCEGDIHPSKAGYELLANVLFKAYNPTL